MGSTVMTPLGIFGSTGGWATDSGGITAGQLAGAITDADDSTFIAAAARGNHIMFTLTDPVLPPFARIIGLQATVRSQGNNSAFMSTAYVDAWGAPGYRAFSFNEVIGSGISTRTYALVTTAPDGPWTHARAAICLLDFWAFAPIKVMEASVTVFYDEAPIITIDGPLTPSNVNNPVVSWSYDDPEDSPQEFADVRVFTDLQVSQDGFDPLNAMPYWSKIVQSTRQNIRVARPLPAGSYWVYVRASEQGSGGRYGDFDVYNFVLTGSAPQSPTFTATADPANRRNVLTLVENDNLIGYNQAGFEDTSDGSGWYADTNATKGIGTSTAAETERTRVLQVTAVAAGLSRVRCGGVWTTSGYGATKNVAIDRPSTPPGRVTNDGTTDLVSATFTPPVASRVYAYMAEDGPSSVTINPTIVSSAGLVMTRISKVDGNTFSNHVGGCVAVWVSSVVGSAVPQTIKLTHHDGFERSLQVVVMTGVHATVPTGAITIGGSTGLVTTSLVSTVAGSWTWGAYADSYAGPIPSMKSGAMVSTEVHDPKLTGVTIRQQQATSEVGTTVDMGTTSPIGGVNANYVIFEILPGSVSGVPSTSLAGIPVVAGSTYSKHASVWMEDNVVRTARIDHEWYDISGTIIGALVTGTTFSTLATTKMARWQEDITAPTGAVCCVLLLTITNATLGEVADWDRIGLILGAGSHWGRGGMRSGNLLDTDNGTQQFSIGDWGVIPGDTWSNVSRVANASVKSGQLLQTYTTAAPHTARAWTNVLPGIIGGETYTFSCLALTAVGHPNGIITVQFYDINGHMISAVASPWVQLGATDWQQLAVTAVAPANATSFRLIVGVWLTTTGIGTAVWWTRMALDVSGSPLVVWQPGPAPATFPLVEFSDDGNTWTEVRFDTLASFDPTNGMLATIYDYEAPPGVPRLYRGAVGGYDWQLDPNGGALLVSAPTDPPQSLTLPAVDWWLKDPMLPGTMLDVEIQGDLAWTRKRKQAVFSPLGRTKPIVVFDQSEGRVAAVVIWIASDADRKLFESMLDSGHTLLLQGDMGEQWYVMADASSSWTLVNAPGRLLGTPLYEITINLIEVDRP